MGFVYGNRYQEVKVGCVIISYSSRVRIWYQKIVIRIFLRNRFQ